MCVRRLRVCVPESGPLAVAGVYLPAALFRRCADLQVGVFMGSTWVGAALAETRWGRDTRGRVARAAQLDHVNLQLLVLWQNTAKH